MSKRIEAKISCPGCGSQFNFTLYRTIWGEDPENRELVMSDKINVATCPNCKRAIKVPYPFMYTNSKQHFAVWWEPEFDHQIGKDSESYVQMMGAGNYFATAPRIKDWESFKNTIIKFEKGILKAKPATMSKELQEQMQGYMKNILSNGKKKNSGCFGVILVLIISGLSIVFGLTKIFL